MIGTIITLSIIAFVLLCVSVLLLVLFRSEQGSHSYCRKFSDNYSHLIERLTMALEDFYEVLNKPTDKADSHD